MSNFNTLNSFGNSFGTGSFSIKKYVKGYTSQPLNLGAGPLLPLPGGFNSYTFSNASFLFTYKEKGGEEKIEIRILAAAKINENLTDYCNECLRTYMTIEFIELVNKSFPPKPPSALPGFSFPDERLEYAISLYNTIYKLCESILKRQKAQIR